MLKRIGTMVVVAATLTACSESIVPTVPTAPTGTTQTPVTPPQSVLAELSCRVDVAANTLTCAPPSPSKVAGRSADLILGGQNVYVRLANAVPTNNGTTLSTTLTVQNLTGQPWGTTNGTTATGTGVRVFFYTGPTNGVTVAAPDTGTFTAANQPYFEYSGALLGSDGILRPNEVSSSLPWQFTLNGQTSFVFQLFISTTLPDEPGVLRWTRSALTQTAPIEEINTVWGSSASDVWTGGTGGATSLHHWDGTTWSAVPGAQTTDVLSIWGSSSSNVYAVGDTKIQRYNGTSWSDVSSGATSSLLAVWGSSATDVYAGGFDGTLVHSTGGVFTPVANTGLGTTEYVAAIWGSSPTDVYVGGTALRRWDGANWSVVNAGISEVRAIWGSSATDVWVVGVDGDLSHLKDGVWTASTLGSATFSGIWGTSANDVWAVTRDGQIYHYNGTLWVENTANGSNAFLAVWGSGRRDVWAVGTDATFSNNVVVHGTR